LEALILAAELNLGYVNWKHLLAPNARNNKYWLSRSV